MQSKWITFVLLAGTAGLTPQSLRAQWKTPWDYEGPRGAEHWSELDRGYAVCNTGKEQSPIDIRNAEKSALPAVRFEYKSEPLKYLINNGHTIRVNYHDSPGTGNFLVVGGERYQLMQFHFHHPSEEYVNGKSYAMVVHLMHQSADGKIAGVAVFLQAGSANRTIEQIWSHMPTTESKEEEVAGIEINPAALLPGNRSYYMYMGSQTAPPCTEGVTWFVLKTPVDISPEQIDTFAKLYPRDVRPLQPLDGRVVKESQ
ncbi:MAG: carbonic anhydrase family protein [Acidobacteriaceae bacterium]|nr:carbonic anhydrase family protein [Acidobacteriaceae bacterium]MBV9765463.1 carbonic anhydrase family protein [Acidobacteriaceae bacterium]